MTTYREDLETLLDQCPNVKTRDHARVVAFKLVHKKTRAVLNSKRSSEHDLKSAFSVLSGYYKE